MEGEMTDRSNSGIKRWMGFKEEESNLDAQNPSQGGALARIRELESQLNELRSRRDITALSKEEFEILATETAMTLIRTAQQREVKARAAAERLIGDSKRAAESALASAESKAKTLLSQAENRGRRLIEAAEGDVEELMKGAREKAEELLSAKRREAIALTGAAKKEADTLISEAKDNVDAFRQWLDETVADAERLYKAQIHSLDAASQAIEQSRSRLDGAWEKLARLGRAIESAIDEEGKPRVNKSAQPSGDDSRRTSQPRSEKRNAPRSKTRKPSSSRKK